MAQNNKTNDVIKKYRARQFFQQNRSRNRFDNY